MGASIPEQSLSTRRGLDKSLDGVVQGRILMTHRNIYLGVDMHLYSSSKHPAKPSLS